MALSRHKSHDTGSEIATIRTLPETNFQGAAWVRRFDHPAPRDRFFVPHGLRQANNQPCTEKGAKAKKGAQAECNKLVVRLDRGLADAFDTGYLLRVC